MILNFNYNCVEIVSSQSQPVCLIQAAQIPCYSVESTGERFFR